LFYQFVSPSGSWVCRHVFISSDRFPLGQAAASGPCLGLASPSERVVQGQGGPLLLLGEPVYFSVFSPRAFSNINLEITYRPHLNDVAPVFELGFLADKDLWRYHLQPVYNFWLEQGLSNWKVINSGNLRLFQKQEKFFSVDDFLETWHNQGSDFCPTPRCLALYNINDEDLPPVQNLDFLLNKEVELIFPYKLRGAHQFYIMVPENGFKLEGFLTDLNENKEKDTAEFNIFSGKRLVGTFFLPDDRSQAEEGFDVSEPQLFSVAKSDLEPGLYRLEFRASDDLVISGLNFNSQHLSIINKIWLFDKGPVSLVTDSSYLQVKTLSPEFLQTLDFGGQKLSIQEIYHQYELVNQKRGYLKIDMPAGGLTLANNGMFAVDASSLLNPDYPRLDRFLPLDDQIDFILADYQSPVYQEDSWLRSSVDFSASDFYREKNHYSLILSVPGLDVEGGQGGFLEIKEIKVKFYGRSLGDKIKEWLHL